LSGINFSVSGVPIWAIAFMSVLATLSGAWLALARPPGRPAVSAVQHLAAGVVVTAAAAGVLPGLKHSGAEWAVTLGGAPASL
jgi:ZIP family zinc transporter